MTESLTLQTANTTSGEYDVHTPVPYPTSVGRDGAVLDGQFWAGEREFLVGFQADSRRHVCDLTAGAAWARPEDALGKFPIWSAGGKFHVILLPVEQIVRRTEHKVLRIRSIANRDDVASEIDVHGKSESEIERVMRGALINMDRDAWFIAEETKTVDETFDWQRPEAEA